MAEWRYLATRLNGNGTETLIHAELPLSRVSITDTLSGPQQIKATLSPEMSTLVGSDGEPVFDPWGVALYAELDGQIRAGGILEEMLAKPDGSLDLFTVGFAGYPKDMPYTEEYKKVGVDPLDAFREIWRHLQSQARGNLGVIVDGTKSPVKLGTEPAKDVNFNTKDGEAVSFVAGGPYTLAWYKTTDLLKEANDLATTTPFEYREVHSWKGDTDQIEHRIKLGYPTIGRRRDDLRFMVGENVYVAPDVLFPGEYASEVLCLGAGEGAKTIRATKSRSGEKRLRRVKVIDVKDADNSKKANAEADKELKASYGRPEIDEIKIIDHPHAALGSFGVGDEIFIVTPEGWQGDLGLWVRITSYTYTPDDDTVASVSVQRVDGN